MYLQANPSKARTEQEKEDIKNVYKIGEQVLPKHGGMRGDSADEEDRRMIEDVRELSLREVGIGDSRSHERGTSHRDRESSRDSRDEEGRRQRRRDERRRREERQSTRHGSGTVLSPGPMDSRSQARQIEHQSSLRSLLSNSNFDSSNLEEEILRQIVDEGLLDGIDLDSLDVAQQDELSERIADAYRQRHRRRSRSLDTRSEASRDSNHRNVVEQPRHRQHGRSSSVANQTPRPSNPSASRPRHRDAYPINQESRRRTSTDNGRTLGSSLSRTSDVVREAARSASDLTERSRAFTHERVRPGMAGGPSQGRRTTDPDSGNRSRVNINQNRHGTTVPGTISNATRNFRTSQPAAREVSLLNFPSAVIANSASRGFAVPVQQDNCRDEPLRSVQRSTLAEGIRPGLPYSLPIVTENSVQQIPGPAEPLCSEPMSAPSSSQEPILYPEPLISCNRCMKPLLEYDLHYNCSLCLDGKYNICLQCYRRGTGCLHWYGFGTAALQRYEQQAPIGGYPVKHPLPHVLTGQRYLRPNSKAKPIMSHQGSQNMTSEDPAKRLQSGVFCSSCLAFANDCFWKCDFCNEGEWGFCNSCINQGKCCTHPLLPLAHSLTKSKSFASFSTQHTETSFSSSRPVIGSFPNGPYTPLTFSTKCDICTYPIPPSSTRFHCPQCNNGDYDICTNCYNRLVSSGRISAENGHKGWRRCLTGHRMIITGFQDSPYRRVVINDLVGGHALKDDIASPYSPSEPRSPRGEGEWTWRDGQQLQSRTITKRHTNSSNNSTPPIRDPALPIQRQQQQPSRFPPDGGIGRKVLATWSFWPEEGAENELAFPKGAIVVEAEDINGDWFWGIYAGNKGLFPGNYGRVIEIVG